MLGKLRTLTRGKAVPDQDSPIDSDPEKHYPHETTEVDGQRVDVYDADLPVPALEHTTERKLLAKIDWRVVPVLTIMYLLAFLDRVNISNGRLFHLERDLGLNTEGTQFNTALVIFFVPYCLFEIPSNILLKKLRPHVWLSGCMFLFGLVTICQGLTSNYGGLLAARFFLGLAETGMFPGCFYLISMWYKREEACRRITFFFSSATLAGAFGGLLAAAIGKMDGIRGYSGWRWIFILEGLLTCLVAIAWFWCISDFPEDAKWLTDEERAYVKARLQADQGRSSYERNVKAKDVGRFFTQDYKAILGGFMYFGLIIPAYGYAYFAPTIIQSYHYGAIETQLRSVPPWAAAWGLAMAVAFASDKTRHRFLWTIFPPFVAIAGFAILLAVHDNRDTQYAALFLVTMGVYSGLPMTIVWFQQNLGGHSRRAIGSAWQVGFGNLGGIPAVFIFLAKDKPRYTTGYAVSLAFCCFSLLASSCYGVACYLDNKKRDKMPVAVGPEKLEEESEKGDLASHYRYMM